MDSGDAVCLRCKGAGRRCARVVVRRVRAVAGIVNWGGLCTWRDVAGDVVLWLSTRLCTCRGVTTGTNGSKVF